MGDYSGKAPSVANVWWEMASSPFLYSQAAIFGLLVGEFRPLVWIGSQIEGGAI